MDGAVRARVVDGEQARPEHRAVEAGVEAARVGLFGGPVPQAGREQRLQVDQDGMPRRPPTMFS